MRDGDGALRRYCRVDEGCPQWNKPWEKRADLIHHIKERHGITIDIPRRPVGRPKGSQKAPLPCGSRSHRQAKTRFGSIETRVKLARKKHLKDLHKSAEKRWLFSSAKGKMPYEEWLKAYIEDQMEKWERDMPNRIAKMQASIAKGYDKMVSVQWFA